MALSHETRVAIAELAARYPERRTALLPALKLAQRDNVPPEVKHQRLLALQALQDVPYVPLGEFHIRSASRSNLTGFSGGTPLFYGVKRV